MAKCLSALFLFSLHKFSNSFFPFCHCEIPRLAIYAPFFFFFVDDRGQTDRHERNGKFSFVIYFLYVVFVLFFSWYVETL